MGLTRVLKNKEGELVTQSGWGSRAFMRNYESGRFKPDAILKAYLQYGRPFGFIMRTLPYLCVDIDGKNGGIQASSILRLTPTLAEISKSGSGFHLFYRIPEATWDATLGYNEFADFNGILPGIDVRAVGIVYHYRQQRWNSEDIAPLPNTLRRLLEQKTAERERAETRRQEQLSLDPEDLAIVRYETIKKLERPIEAGKRNTTLFALGCELKLYQVPDWEQLLYIKGERVGLSERELSQIIRNVKRYS